MKKVSKCPHCGAPIYAKARDTSGLTTALEEPPETVYSCACRHAWQALRPIQYIPVPVQTQPVYVPYFEPANPYPLPQIWCGPDVQCESGTSLIIDGSWAGPLSASTTITVTP